ncbi:TERB2 isoform 2 [Pan troglodytes]|uniref:TERB2 isoform 2 n=2 Tax=Pan troglodytes TaxID=9598 RepID=A0A2J8NTM7_PANTR|nr:TERB2 isoform 2 [Pan troglodytes]
MFQGQRGWFCGSVSQDLRQFWGRKLSGSSGLGGKGSILLSLMLWVQGA